MSVQARMQAAPTIAVGLCLIAVGIGLTLDRLGIVDAYSFVRLWPLAIVAYGGALVLKALFPPTDPEAIAQARAYRGGGGGGLLLVILVLAIFAPRIERESRIRGADSRDTISSIVVLGTNQHASTSHQFRGGDAAAFIGQSVIDLRDATLAPGVEPSIDVVLFFGGITVRVPQGWTVDVRAVPVFGDIRDRRFEPAEGSDSTGASSTVPPATAEGAPRLVIRGVVMLGHLVIAS